MAESERALVWVQQPSNVRLPSAIDPPPVVEVRLGDSPDPRIVDGEVRVEIEKGPEGALLHGNVARCPKGVATFDNLRPSLPGAYVLRAECDESQLVIAPEGRRVEISVPAGRVDAVLNGFPLFIDLSLMPSEMWAEAKRDGGDLRVKSANGDLLPMDLVRYDPIARGGSLFVRVDLSPDQETIFYLYWGTEGDERLPVDHPAGRHAVWADFHRVMIACEELVDRTGTGAVSTVPFAPILFERVDESPNLGVHQGIAFDGEHFYATDTNAIRKFDRDWNLLGENTDPISEIGHGVNHLGDPVCHAGKLYIPTEFWSGNSSHSERIAVFDSETLSLIASYDVSAQGHEVSGCCIGPDGLLYVTSYLDGSKLWRYELETLSFIDTLPLSSSIGRLQGITFWRDAFWVSRHASPGCEVFRVETDGVVHPGPVWKWSTGVGEGIGHDDDSLWVLVDPGNSNGVAHRVKPFDVEAGGGIQCQDGASVRMDAEPSAEVTVACTMVPFEESQMAAASYSATFGTSNRLSLATRLGVVDSIGIWDRNNTWLHPDPVVPPMIGEKHRVHAVYNDSEWRKIFVNGAGTLEAGITPLSAISNLNRFYIGRGHEASGSEVWNGLLGYVYIRLGVLSDEWIAAECSNLESPGDFFNVGDPEFIDEG